MKVYLKQFLSPTHSWGNVGINIIKQLKNLGHDISLCSTNGYAGFPKELEENIICKNCTTPQDLGKSNCIIDRLGGNVDGLGNSFDLSISYTQMTHYPAYLRHAKNKFGLWIYDGTQIPKGYIKYHKGATKMLPASNFAKNVFISNGAPKDKIFVVPHGYDKEFVKENNVYPLKTNRKRKFLINIQQPHTRKNLRGILDTWGRTFTNKDDVVLVAKVKDKKPKASFEVSWRKEYDIFKKKYKNHAPVIVIDKFIERISDLYRACDIVFSMSNTEGFWLPGLEGLAAGKLVIGSGGELGCGNIDFMNDENSLLIKGKIVRAPHHFQYWRSSIYGEMFEPDKDHASELLLKAANEYDDLLEKFKPGIEYVRENYTWEKVVQQIIGLVE
jgi:glycosyltransferase involved in cell wall biosynthesis